MDTTVVSFFTDAYAPQGIALREACRHMGLRHLIRHEPGQWRIIDAFRHKPEFILEQLRRVKDPVLWIDADCTLIQPPTFCDTLTGHYDVGAVFRGPGCYAMKGRKWLVCALWFDYTKAATRLLEAWKVACEAEERDDDILFQEVAMELEDQLRIAELPRSFAARGNKEAEPVIRFNISGNCSLWQRNRNAVAKGVPHV